MNFIDIAIASIFFTIKKDSSHLKAGFIPVSQLGGRHSHPAVRSSLSFLKKKIVLHSITYKEIVYLPTCFLRGPITVAMTLMDRPGWILRRSRFPGLGEILREDLVILNTVIWKVLG